MRSFNYSTFYTHALHRNPGKTALIVSHKDQDCLYRHYLGIATKAAAAKYFKNFKLEGHTLMWPNGADFAPEYLHALMPQIQTT